MLALPETAATWRPSRCMSSGLLTTVASSAHLRRLEYIVQELAKKLKIGKKSQNRVRGNFGSIGDDHQARV